MSSGYPMGKQYELYLGDESRRMGQAEEIYFVTTKEELASALETHLPITLQGARTGLDGLAVPHGGRIINLSRMKGVLKEEHLPDGTLALDVLPGTTMEELKNDYSGYFFPAMPSELSSTVGGCIATQARSIFTAHYGALSNYIQVTDTLPLPNGQQAIAAARITLRPVPQALWAIAFFFPEETAARQFSAKAEKMRNVAVNEYMDEGALAAITKCAGAIARLDALPKMLQTARAMVYLELHDTEEDTIFESAEMLLTAAADLGCPDEATWSFSGEREVWKAREVYHAAQDGVNTQIDTIRLITPTLYGTGVEFVKLTHYEEYRRQWDALGVPYACFGNVCEGRMRLCFIPETEAQYETAVSYISSLPHSIRR